MGILKGKVAIITGGAQGIGKAIALRFAKEGADVVVGDIDYEKVERTVEEIIDSGFKAKAIRVDVSIRKDVDFLIEAALSEFGRIDILVNNAAIVTRESFLSLSEEIWDRTIEVNLKGTFLCSQVFSKSLIKSNKKGKIINLASICSVVVNPYSNLCAYEVSKAGVVMLTKRMAFELAPYGINVNAIAPSVVKTRMVLPENEKKLLSHIPLKRIATPEDITGPVVFLASKESDYITGAVLFVDGGWLTY